MPYHTSMTPEEILSGITGLAHRDSRSLSSLFKLWRSLDRRLEQVEVDSADTSRRGDTTKIKDNITSAQTKIMEMAQSAKCRNLDDVAYKLALWRWDAAETVFDNDMDRRDKILYSAFLDIVVLSDTRELLAPEDIRIASLRTYRSG